MKAKRWVLVALCSFILLGFSTHQFLYSDSQDGDNQQQLLQFPFVRELKKNILSMIDGAWTSTQDIEMVVPSSNDEQISDRKGSVPQRVVLSPNLTTCHRSLSDADVPVYCCPPKRESTEPFIDFQFPSTSEPVRIRRPVHLATEDYISKYNRAISIMKSLPYDDPRSYLRQANMHCIYCTGAYNQQYTNFLLKIHRSWLFFPWHRIMIYFHERILGSLIGDENFALPFWNWDTPAGMMIPSMYMNGSLNDPDRDSGHLPPQVADINFDYVESGLGPEEQISTNVAFMYNQMVSGAKKTELFMGCPYKAGEDGFCDGPGTIELAPHNALHTWVGSELYPERENMGAFYSAARDPIFYSHHANIDRLWEVWRGFKGNDKLDIVDPDWLDAYFFFHDEKSQLVRVRIRDVLDITKLKYTYENVHNPWLNARPKPSVPPKIARHVLRIRENEEKKKNSLFNSSPHFGSEGRAVDETIRIKVQRPKTHRTKAEKEEEEEVLVVYGIDIQNDKYVKFDVYINAVDETIIGPESREFAGTFVNMKKGVRLVMNKGDAVVKRKTNLKLGISEVIEDLEADSDESIWVSLVPRGGTGVHVKVDGVRIEYMR